MVYEIPAAVFEEIRVAFGAEDLRAVPPDSGNEEDEGYRVLVAENRTGAVIPGWTVRLVENPLKAGPSVFTFPAVPEALPLFDCPLGVPPGDRPKLLADLAVLKIGGDSVVPAGAQLFDWRRSGRLLGRAARDFSIEAWDRLNAKLCPEKGVNLIAAGFEGDSSLAHWQEAKWLGGKGNDLVICYGPPGPGGFPAWTYGFGWTEDELVKRNLESLFLTRVPGDGLLPAIRDEVRARYRKKVWPDRSYLEVPAPRGAVPILILVTVFVQGGYWWWAYRNRSRRAPADAAEEAEARDDRRLEYSGAHRRAVDRRLRKGLAHLQNRRDVDLLTREMLGGREPALACLALTRSRNRRARTALVLGLTSANPFVRREAADWLNEHVPEPRGCPEAAAAVPRLLERLADPEAVVRREARRVLDLVDPEWRSRPEAARDIPGLLGRLDGPDPAPEVLDALGARGALVADRLLAMTAGPGDATRSAALRALARTGDPRAVPFLAEDLDAGEEPRRAAALDGLAWFGGEIRKVPEAAPLAGKILPLLGDARPGRRALAVRALGRLGGDPEVPGIAPLLRDPARGVRYAAMEALSHIGTSAAVRALLARLPEAGEAEQAALVEALGRTGDRAIAGPLIDLFAKARRGGSLLPEAIIDALFPLGGPEVEALLDDASSDLSCSASEHAARRLRRIRRGPSARPWERD